MTWWPLTFRGTAAVAVGAICAVVAMVSGITELLFFAVLLYALVGGGILSLWLRPSATATARVIAPTTPAVGTLARVAVQVRGVGRGAAITRWQDRVGMGLQAEAAGDFDMDATPGATRGIEYTVLAQTRGLRSLGPLVVTDIDPFGLTRRARMVLPAVTLRVAPAIQDVAVLAGLTAHAGGALRATLAHRGHGVDNLLARPYQPGDSMRRIHWRASARSDELMVRQEEDESAPDATVVFDRDGARYSPGALTPGDDEQFEAAVSAVVSAVTRLSADGYRVQVIDADGAELHPTIEPADSVECDAFAAACATVAPRDDIGLARLTAALPATELGPLVVVTGRLTLASIESFGAVAVRSPAPIIVTTGVDVGALDRADSFGWTVGTIRVHPQMPTWWESAPDASSATAAGSASASAGAPGRPS